MALNFRKFFEGLKIIPKTSSTADAAGEMDVTSGNGKLNYHNGTTPSPIVTEAHASTLTNKTIDGDDNTIQDLALASLKTVLADANKVIQRDASGIVVSGPLVPAGSGDLVRTDSTQTLTNKTIDGDNNTVQDLALTSLKTVLADANKVVERDASGIVVSGQTRAASAYVGVSDTQALTNKTIDGDLNTVQDLALTTLKTDGGNANKFIQRDGSGIVVNGPAVPTGPVVGTTDTQTLTNKSLVDASTSIVDDGDNTKVAKFQASGITTGTTRTFTFPNANTTLVGNDTTQTLTNKTLTAPIESAPSIVDYADFTDQSSTPSSPGAGHHLFYPKTDGKFYSLNSSGTEVVIGSGSGGGSGVNLGAIANKNIDAESSATDWTTYNDGGASYVDGTGGSVTGVTFTRTTTGGEVLNGVGSFKLSKDAANRQGMGVSIDMPVPLGYRGQPGKLNFPVKISSNYVAGDVGMYLYDITNSRVITPIVSNINLPGGQQDLFQAFFYIPSDCANIRTSFFINTTSALAYDVLFDDFGVLAITGFEAGSQDTDWVQYTPTFTGWGTPTNVFFESRRDGSDLLVRGVFNAGSTTAANAAFSLGYNGTNLNVTSSPDIATVESAGSVLIDYSGIVWGLIMQPSNQYVSFSRDSVGALTIMAGNNVSPGKLVALLARVPITGWTTGSRSFVDIPTKKVIATANLGSTQSISNSTNTDVVFSTTTEDTDAQYNPSTGVFTVKYPGDVKITAAIAFESNGTGTRIMWADYNGTVKKFLALTNAVSGDVSILNGSCTIENCVPGDVIKIRCSQGSGGSLNIGVVGVNANYVSFERVNDRVQITPSSEAVVELSLSSNTTPGAGNPLIYNVVDSDITGMYNAGTGRFTPKAPGFYLIAVTQFASTPASGDLQLWKNGSVLKRFNYTGDAFAHSGAQGVRCNGTTDYFDIRPDNGSTFGGIVNLNCISVVKVAN